MAKKDIENKLVELENKYNGLKQVVETLSLNPSDLQQRIQSIQNIVGDNVLANIQTNVQSLNDAYNQIFVTNGDLSKKFIDEYNKINELYKYFYDTDNGKTKKDILIQEIEDFLNQYQELIGGDESKYGEFVKSFDEFNDKKLKLDEYHDEIFIGNEKQKSLKDKIDDRLKELKNVESEAKKVIELSSDAGLAGGFHQMAESVKKNKKYSLYIFLGVLALMATYNFILIFLIDTTNLLSLSMKLLVNAPLVWIATVANINLNKYTKLEQEYAHKESLAKSFERYKTEVLKLENNASQELLQKLMELNLEAFKKNPADSLDKIKSDDLIDNVIDSASGAASNKKN